VLTPLLLKAWRDHWKGTTVWTIGLVLLVAVEQWVYPSIRDSAAGMAQLIEAYPEAMRAMFRMEDYTSGTGFLNVELFSIMVPIAFIAIGASWGSTATADEEERGTADLLLTFPVSRTQVIVTKMIAAVVTLLALALVLWVSLLVGNRLIDVDIGLGNLLSTCLLQALLGILFCGVGFLVGAVTGRRGIALGVAITLALAAFLAYSLAPMAEGFERLNPVNPFAWTLGGNPLVNGLDAGYALRLAVVALVLFACSVLAFRRRDIAAG
jgi:ABC-2 type transport system permease protein